MAARRQGPGAREVALRADFDLRRLFDSLRPRPELRVPVRRPDDLLVFDLLVHNLALQPGESPRLERQNPAAAAYLIVELPPQSFAEEAFLEAADPGAEADLDKELPQHAKWNKPTPANLPDLRPLPSARVRMAGRSRLAFTMPPGTTSLPYTLAAVLEAMRTWPPSLDLNALPDASVLGELGLGRDDWLTAAASSAGWREARAGLTAGLTAAGGGEVDRALAASAQRIAERAAGGLAGSARRVLGRVMFETLHGEMEELVRRFPALREGAAHQAGLAALSLAAAEALAPAAARAGFDAGAIVEMPFLPFLIGPHEPPRHVTALELPYRLLLSPVEAARWRHRDAPVERRGRTELWHTRLSTAAGEVGPDAPSKVRALWSPDYPKDLDLFPFLEPPKPFRASLDPLDRRMLVQLMAGYDEKRRGGPLASEAKRLHLSALGGLLDVEGNWEHRPTTVDLEQWRHLAALGRDAYVRVVYAGFLCPFGHSASLVKVTERKFESLEPSQPRAPRQRAAVLRQRFFIIVRERVKRYPGPGHEFEGRNFPLREVEVLTRVTPDLAAPGAEAPSELAGFTYGAIARRMVFWPVVPASPQAVDFRFEILATDTLGERSCFSLPLLFVGEIPNFQAAPAVRAAYNLPVNAPRRRASLGGACVCYAPYDPGAKGDPRLPTEEMTFAAGALTIAPQRRRPNFHPETERAGAGIPALQKLLGQNAVVGVIYPDVYKKHGLGGGGNPGEVFLQLETAYGLEFGGEGKAKSDAVGALAAPQMAIVGLSRITGPVAAAMTAGTAVPASKLAKAVANQFDPADFFPPKLPAGAKILGGVDLGAILGPAITGLEKPEVPKLLSRADGDTVVSSFEWETEVKQPDPLKLLIPRATPGAPTRLVMRSTVTTPRGAAGSYDTEAELTNFKVNLFGCIVLWFERLRFEARQGRKPDVTVQLRQGSDAVQFGGPLEFVNELREVIPSNGFSDPPSLAVTPSGISASYSLNLPTIGVGIFSLSNVSLGAGFDLPFDARPASVRFNFAERQRPFSLTVAFLGGGGFFAIGISTQGVREIEAALEFGAALVIDLGVASGGVEIKAGVYFHWLEATPGGSVELAGYVRIHGELSVLAIISVSLTFELKLAYLKDKGAHRSLVWGEASLIVEIEILFFSFDVTVRVRREFAGGASDPKFIDLVPDEATWTEYCEAFAEEAA